MVDPDDKKFLQLCVSKQLVDKKVATEAFHRARKEERSAAKVLVDMGALPSHMVDALTRELNLALAPDAIAGFRIISKLGQGGMGSVYLAEQLSLNREVALKIIAPQFASDAQAVDRFMREARVAAAINHSNIISVIDVGYDGGHLYMALELVSGGDAGQLAARSHGVLSEVRALEIIGDCSLGLGALYEAHQIHRDIKPANIFITKHGIAKLADLGLARSEHGDDRLTVLGHAVGTPAFMSPEQAGGKVDVDIRSDIYSLGASLFALTTGSPPFLGNGAFATVAKLLTETAPDPRSLNPALSVATAEIITRCLAKLPADRFQTPQELSIAIAEVLAANPSAEKRPVTASIRKATISTRPGTAPIARSSTSTRPGTASITNPTTDVSMRSHQTPPTARVRKPRPTAAKSAPRAIRWPIIGGIAAVIAVAGVVGMSGKSHAKAPPEPIPSAAVAAVLPAAPSTNPPVAKIAPVPSERPSATPPVVKTAPVPSEHVLPAEPTTRPTTVAPTNSTSSLGGLIAYWPLDEGTGLHAGDVSGHKATGTIVNAVWGPGKIGGGLVFSPPSRVDCGNAAILVPTTGITVMCWIKSTMVVTEPKFISVIRHDGHFNALQLFVNGNAKTAIWSGGTLKIFDFLWRGVWDDGIWHHFAVTYDCKEGVRIFKDGKSYATEKNIVGNLAPSSSNSFMLGAAETNTEHFNGSLDEVRVYDRALNAAEIQSLAAVPIK